MLHLIKTPVGATWALRLMTRLAALGVEVEVVIPDAHGPVAEACAAAGLTSHVLQTDLMRLRSPAALNRATKALRAILDQVRPDILHSHFVGTTMFARLALGRRHPTPRIFQVPGPLHLENPITRRAEIVLAGAGDHWIATCEATRGHYLKAGVPADRAALSYYGFPASVLDGCPPAGLRRSLGLADSTQLIGMVAYVYPPKRWLGQTRGLKGHEDLIDAAALLIAGGADIACVFVGGAWAGADRYEAEVRAYAQRRLGARAIFLGSRRDVAALYGDFDVAVHPSHSENVGGAAESLFLAVPTVATRVGGFPDVVIDGETGWLAAARSPVDLARAIGDALGDPAEARRRAANGSQLVRRLFDLDRTAGEVLGVYRNLLSTGVVNPPVGLTGL